MYKLLLNFRTLYAMGIIDHSFIFLIECEYSKIKKIYVSYVSANNQPYNVTIIYNYVLELYFNIPNENYIHHFNEIEQHPHPVRDAPPPQ